MPPRRSTAIHGSLQTAQAVTKPLFLTLDEVLSLHTQVGKAAVTVFLEQHATRRSSSPLYPRTSSTLRFAARPRALSLGAIGLVLPRPCGVRREASMPAVARYCFTAAARRVERSWLCSGVDVESVWPSMVSFQSACCLSTVTTRSSVGFDSSRRWSESESKLMP